MRGKTILWLTLIALLVGFSLPSFGFAQCETVISVEPPDVTGLLPGQSFGVGIRITGAVNVHAWEVKLGYAPYMNLLVVTNIIEGPFLKAGGPTTFATYIDAFYGFAMFGATGTNEHYGIGGDGFLAYVIFSILEAGECELELYDTKLLNRDQEYLPHCVEHGYFLGPTADLVPPDLPTERPIGGGKEQADWKKTMVKRWGTTEVFSAGVTNLHTHPTASLWARIRYTSVNEHTGEVITLYSGQSYLPTVTYRTEILYVNEVSPHPWGPYFYEWTNFGTSPYLDAIEDGSYTEGYQDAALSDVFGFEDITLGPVDTIDNVRIEGYCRAESADVDMDVYTWGPVPMAWLGSLWGDPTYSWKTPRWTTDDVSDVVPLTLTEAGLNDLAVALYYYAPWEDPPGSEGPAACDCLKLIVTIRTGGVVPAEGPWYLVGPGETVEPPPAVWYLEKQNTGKWHTTIALEYRYIDPSVPSIIIVSGPTTFTYEWWIKGEGID